MSSGRKQFRSLGFTARWGLSLWLRVSCFTNNKGPSTLPVKYNTATLAVINPHGHDKSKHAKRLTPQLPDTRGTKSDYELYATINRARCFIKQFIVHKNDKTYLSDRAWSAAPWAACGGKGRDVYLIFWLPHYVVNQHLQKPGSHTFLPCGRVSNCRQHSRSSVCCAVNTPEELTEAPAGPCHQGASVGRGVPGWWGWTGLRRPLLPSRHLPSYFICTPCCFILLHSISLDEGIPLTQFSDLLKKSPQL